MDFATLKAKGLVRPARGPAAETSGVTFPFGLGRDGVHELVECKHGDFAALTGFACAALSTAPPKSVLWVGQEGYAREHGGLRQDALSRLWPYQAACLHVATRKVEEALWAVEEGIVSGAVNLVVAELSGADFTASRRLTLAAKRTGVPLVLLLPHTHEGTTSAEARWSVRPRASGPNRYDPHAPGLTRWQVVLERSRAAPEKAGTVYNLEFDDETLSLRHVSGLADRSVTPRDEGPEHPEKDKRRADIVPLRRTG